MGRGITAMTGIPTTGKLYRHRTLPSWSPWPYRTEAGECVDGEIVLVLRLWPCTDMQNRPDVLLLTSQGHIVRSSFSRDYKPTPDREGWHHWWEELEEEL